MHSEEFQRRFRHGRDLFHQGQYFECHEEWEEIWRVSEGAPRRLLQGLIQAAVGFHHLHRGNRVGAERVWARGLANLRDAAPRLNCEQQIRNLVTSLQSRLEASCAPAGDAPPYLELEQIPLPAAAPPFSRPERTA